MIGSQQLKIKLRTVLIITGAWVIVALFISSSSFVTYADNSSVREILGIIIYEILCISPWMVLTPLLVKVTRKFRFNKDNLLTSVIGHFITALGVFTVHAIVQSFASSVYYDFEFTRAYVGQDFLRFLDMRVMLYLGVLLILYTIEFQKKERATQLRKTRLKNQLSKAKFQALVNKMQPVFFMNCIESVQSFLESNPSKSEHILTDFSDLLRIILQNMKKEEVTIYEDLETLNLYLDLLEHRMDSEIKRNIQIEDNMFDALLPPVSIFIPIVEEMMQFVQKKEGRITAFTYQLASKQNELIGKITINVQNVSLPHFFDETRHHGLKTIKEYLFTKYGEKGSIKVNFEGDERVSWLLKIPLMRVGNNDPNEKKLWV